MTLFAQYLIRFFPECQEENRDRLPFFALSEKIRPAAGKTVCRRAGDAPSLLLLEARRGGRPGLDIAAPLCLEDGTGRPTAELDNAYFRTKETNA